MRAAEHIRVAMPDHIGAVEREQVLERWRHGRSRRREWGHHRERGLRLMRRGHGTRSERRDHGEQFRLLQFRPSEILCAVETQEPSDHGARKARKQRKAPTLCGRSNPERSQRVADIVLTIPEGPLSVLPGFSPMDRRQTRDERACRIGIEERARSAGAEHSPPLERMRTRRIVIDRSRITQFFDRGQYHVALGRMEVPTGRIRAKRPRCAVERLPRGK